MTLTKIQENSCKLFSSKKTFLTEQPKSTFKPHNTSETDKYSRVCFAESLETVHEIPYNNIFSKADFHSLKLPRISGHKYLPLLVCDPFAKPTKNRRDEFFVDDPFKLPFLDHYKMTMAGLPSQSKASGMLGKTGPVHKSAVYNNSKADKFDKLHNGGNTVHFKYSDFVLRKMDAIKYEKG